jgi:plastocyanin
MTGVLLAVGMIFGFVLVTAPAARGANVAFSLYGSEAVGWGLTSGSEMIPAPTLTVHQGDSVTITLHSTDGLSHEFFIDLNGHQRPEAGDPTSSAFSSTTTVTFTASTAGTFAYLCFFHPTMMKGSFVVQGSAGSTAPSGTGGVGVNLSILGAIGVGIAAVVGLSVVLVLRRR